MRKYLIAASLMATTAISALAPQIAAAQDRCEQVQHDNRVKGTILGAIGGAVLGGVVAGNRGHKEDGALLGAVAGGFIGNQVAGGQNACPEGYRRVDNATYGLHQREFDLDQRIRGAVGAHQLDPRDGERALDRLADIRNEEDDMRARNGGHLIEPDRAVLWDQLNGLERSIPWRAAPPPPPPPPPVYDEWHYAPLDLHDREAWIDQRIHAHAQEGRLAPDDARRLSDQLRWIRDEEYWMVQDHGYLTPGDANNLQEQLGNLIQRFRHVLR